MLLANVEQKQRLHLVHEGCQRRSQLPHVPPKQLPPKQALRLLKMIKLSGQLLLIVARSASRIVLSFPIQICDSWHRISMLPQRKPTWFT